jgi:hypothetical protein
MKSILSGLFLLASIAGSAQVFQLGVRGGVNLFDIQVSEVQDPNNTLESIESGDRKLGYHAGLYGRIQLATFFIQPEMLYTFQNSEVKYTDNGGTEKTLEVDYSRFDIPVIVGAKLGPIRLGVGPVATFAINKPDDAFNQSLSEATFGYQAGIGIDLGKLSIEARYEGPFSKIADSITIEGETYQADSRSNTLLIGLGYQLF